MSFIFGGGSGGGGSTSGTQVSIAREAPEVESRKLALYDQAAKLAEKPVGIPAFQVAGPSGLEQTGFTQAGTTGVGAPTTTAGIGSVLQSMQGPNINQFLNPYQSYVTDEITRQANIASNQLSANAVGAGAFGGARQGIAEAEIERARLANIGQAQAQGFQTALGAAQRQQQVGLAAGQQLGQLGAGQQQMAQADINQLIGAGGIQQQLAQQALDAQRATQLQQAYEPYQRAEFLANLYSAGPKTQSGLTLGTAPTTSPLAQAVGTGIGAFTAYQGLKQQ